MSQMPWKTKKKRVVTGCPTWQVEGLHFFIQSHPGRWVTNIGHHFQRGALCSPLHTKRGITIHEPLVNTSNNSQTKTDVSWIRAFFSKVQFSKTAFVQRKDLWDEVVRIPRTYLSFCLFICIFYILTTNTGELFQEKKLNPYLTLYIKFNFRCILYLNVKDKIKLLVDNIVYSFPTFREKKNLPKKGT